MAIIVGILVPLAWLPLGYSYISPKMLAMLSAPALLLDRTDRLDMAVGAVYLWSVLCAGFAENISLCIFGRPNDHSTGLLAMAWMLFVYLARRRPMGRELSIGAAAVAVVSIGQYILQGLGVMGSMPGGRSVGTIGGPPYLGNYLAVILPISRPWAFPVILGGLGTSLSRGAWIAALGGLFPVIFWKWRRFTKPFLAVSALIGALAASKVGFDPGITDLGRIEAALGSVQSGVRNPVVGVGPSSLAVRANTQDTSKTQHWHTHSHNDILEAFATTGAVGLVLYLWLWFEIGRKLYFWGGPEYWGFFLAAFIALKFNPTGIVLNTILAVGAGGLRDKNIRR